MNREEAIAFLELTASAERAQIESAWQQRYNYFKMLHANAPNDILKRLHQSNLDKLEEIKKILGIQGMGAQPRSQYHETDNPPQANNPGSFNETQKPIAYIILHTEGKATRSFALFEGLNYICRKRIAGSNCVVIDDDMYLSRIHCTLHISKASGYQCELSDDGSGIQGKPSTNGTYINGQGQRIVKRILNNYDTIQAGNTKLVFRWKEEQNTADIEEEIRHTGFVKTVVINL